MNPTYRAAMMLGRLSNGTEPDRGTQVHAVYRKQVPSPRIPGITISVEVALCGKRPGPRCMTKLSKERKHA